MDYQLVIWLAAVSLLIVCGVSLLIDWIAHKLQPVTNQEECCAEETVNPTSAYIDQ